MAKLPVEVSGIWLRRIGEDAQVLAEINGEWRLLICEPLDANFSHIIEPSGMLKAPHDPVTLRAEPK